MQKKTTIISRELFPEVVQHLKQPEITLITGSRQVGKTVLLGQLKQHLIAQQNVSEEYIFFYNLDLVQDQETLRDQAIFIQFLRDRSRTSRIYVFVDEAQKVPEAPRFFKGIYDSGIHAKLILTGSASLEAKAQFKETLAGRKRIFVLSPFTFQEFMRVRDASLARIVTQGGVINLIDTAASIRLYKEYMRFGGYPRVVLATSQEEKEAHLKEIVSSYVEKDAINFWNVQHPSAFNRLLKLLGTQIGQLVNIQELAMNLAIDRHTVERYITLLEETFIIRTLTPYFHNPRQEITKAGKVYFMDMGIRNIIVENTSDIDIRLDQGHVLENAVFIELERLCRQRGGALHFWRTKQKTEVDFVREHNQECMPYEVKYTASASIHRGLRSFIQTFFPKKAYMVTLTEHLPERKYVDSVAVQYVYPFRIDIS